MNRQRIYEYLVTARGRLLEQVRRAGEAGYGREFPVGPGTLARTLTHMFISEWYYVERIEGREVAPYAEWPIQDETPPPFAGLEEAWRGQVGRTRRMLEAERDWDAPIVYRVTDDDGRLIEVTTTASDIFTQLVLHEVHHRAQVMNILRQLGIAAEELDFNSMMYDRRVVAG